MGDPLKELYLEITQFLSEAGGAYAAIDTATYRDIIDALLENRYRLVRNATGNINTFTTWWLIHEQDIELVKSGGRPADVAGGTIVYVADHAGQGGYTGLIRFLRTIAQKACWHHRYKQSQQFRFYPSKRGAYE